MERDEVKAEFDDPSLVFERAVLLADSLRLTVRDTTSKETYALIFLMDNDKMRGRYEATGTGESGNLTGGKQKNVFAELYSSPATVPLYEYQTESGEYHYSTAVTLPAMQRSEKPICRVWRNPSSILVLDHAARPVIPGE